MLVLGCHCESFSITFEKLLHSSVNRFGSRRRRPAVHDIALLIDQELFKVPLYSKPRNVRTTPPHPKKRHPKKSPDLDASQTQDASFLVLEPFVNRVGVVAVDVGFPHERKGNAVVELTKRRDGGVVARFLTTKLEHEI